MANGAEDVSKSTISEHISKVFSDSELDEESTVRKFRTVQTEGNVEKGRRRTEDGKTLFTLKHSF